MLYKKSVIDACQYGKFGQYRAISKPWGYTEAQSCAGQVECFVA